jgi:hypothetical protein
MKIFLFADTRIIILVAMCEHGILHEILLKKTKLTEFRCHVFFLFQGRREKLVNESLHISNSSNILVSALLCVNKIGV